MNKDQFKGKMENAKEQFKGKVENAKERIKEAAGSMGEKRSEGQNPMDRAKNAAHEKAGEVKRDMDPDREAQNRQREVEESDDE
jgi:hypothetical protein